MAALAKTTPLIRSSIFDGIVLYEPIDAALLNKCIHCDLLVEDYDDQKWFRNEKKHLENYGKNVKKNFARVEYKRSEGYEIGRFNPVGCLGLHSIRKATRHTLVNGLMRDVDIENAHNQFLVQILRHNKYDGEYDMLIDYCENRENWREDIIIAWNLQNSKYSTLPCSDQSHAKPKEIAKNLIIRILYGGELEQWLKAWDINHGSCPPKIELLITQMTKIHKWICLNNPDLFEFCKENNLKMKKDYNHEGTTVSWFLQEKECIVLEEMYKYLLDKGVIQNDVCALCNDGIMVEDKYYKPELLHELNSAVKEATGFDLKFIEKPLTDGYERIIDDHIIFDLWDKDITDGMYADYFKLLYSKDFVVRHGFLYTYNGVYWEKDEQKKNTTLSTRVDKEFKEYIVKKSFHIRSKMNNDLSLYEQHLFLDEEENTLSSETVHALMVKRWGSCKDVPATKDPVIYLLNHKISQVNSYIKGVDRYLRNVTTRDKLIRDCVRVLSNTWIEFDSNEYLLAFENKLYDLKEGRWIKPRYDYYVSLTTGWKWIHGYNSKHRDELLQLLKKIFPSKEIRDFYLQVLSTGIYGKTIQHFFVAKGVGGNGKSVINSLMMKCVGNYGYKLPSTAVSQTIKEGANPAIANLNNKRFCLFQEPDRKNRICCSTIKEITGDKELNCRTLYSTDTLTRLKCSLLGEFNDLPALDESGDAMGRRLIVVAFQSMFLTYARYSELSEDDKRSGKFFLADPYYTSDAFQDEYKQALMEILIESFGIFQSQNYTFKPPKPVIQEADEYLKYSDDFYGWFNDKFVKDSGSYTPFKLIWNEFRGGEYYNNMTKADKRKYTQKHLKDSILTNMFLKDSFKRKGVTYKRVQLPCDSIVGWKAKQCCEAEIW